jgi:hypothetical protein
VSVLGLACRQGQGELIIVSLYVSLEPQVRKVFESQRMETKECHHQSIPEQHGATSSGKTRSGFGVIHRLLASAEEFIDGTDKRPFVARRYDGGPQTTGGTPNPPPIPIGRKRTHGISKFLDAVVRSVTAIGAREVPKISDDPVVTDAIGDWFEGIKFVFIVEPGEVTAIARRYFS